MRIAEDLTGRTYNNFMVESLAYVTNYHRYWRCRCVCGRRVAVFSGNLKAGKSKSCGCVRDALTKARSRTHGHTTGKSPSPEYQTWQSMLSRCYKPKNKAFKNYGGRGITVCDQWRSDFPAFLRDMGLRPSARHSIERRDNATGYSAENCYWATKTQQNRNTRRNHFIEHAGQRQTLQGWANQCGIDRLILLKRLKRGWSTERALTEPLMKNQFRYR